MPARGGVCVRLAVVGRPACRERSPGNWLEAVQAAPLAQLELAKGPRQSPVNPLRRPRRVWDVVEGLLVLASAVAHGAPPLRCQLGGELGDADALLVEYHGEHEPVLRVEGQLPRFLG